MSMTKEEQIKRLEEGQKLPHATLEDLSYIPKGISTEKLEEYLTNYAKPTGKCWFCQKQLIVDWGLQHGMAHCTSCGMQTKMYHFVKGDNGEDVRFERGFQYHPKNFSIAEEE